MTVSTTCKTVVLVPVNSQSIHTHLFTRKYNSSWIRARDAFTIRLGYKIPFCYDDDARRIVKKYIELQALRSTSHIIQNNGQKNTKTFFLHIWSTTNMRMCTLILAYSIFGNNNFCTQSILHTTSVLTCSVWMFPSSTQKPVRFHCFIFPHSDA